LLNRLVDVFLQLVGLARNSRLRSLPMRFGGLKVGVNPRLCTFLQDFGVGS
jgi:hypothetical protein